MLEASFHTVMDGIGGFENSPTLVVACSGGSDSMALLLLAEEWALSRRGKVVALTVDHHLRAESTSEAHQVAAWCQARSIEHHTLNWYPDHPTKPTQDDAREARYALLIQWCRAHQRLHLLTAHHRDDQAETLFFRLGRGSKLDGLSCMASKRCDKSVRLLRPLLDYPKESLIHYLKIKQQEWVEDPSNHSPGYTRNRLRHFLSPALSARACGIILDYAKIRNLLENKTASYLTQCFSLYPYGYGLLDQRAFSSVPFDIGVRILGQAIQTVGGDPHPPRTSSLHSLYDALLQPAPAAQYSLGQCLLAWRPGTRQFMIYRAPHSVPPPIEVTHPVVHWDRFVLTFNAPLRHAGLSVRALGVDGVQAIESRNPEAFAFLPRRILPQLPGLWSLEEWCGAPHMYSVNPHPAEISCKVRFLPPKPLADGAFFRLNGSTFK